MYHYVYILQSINHPDKHYTGYTTDLETRLKKHNEGGCKYSATYKPWKIQTAISFCNKETALKFEKYLKSHSGRAFCKKHF
ncbi:MAG: excinuclease ABC subunit C [Ignavibacteria bacterium RBG_13_36_8]|nr:MAG: excinuclease ABC subunit C [Ignavibacteria bacterium RBG_13_36_8]